MANERKPSTRAASLSVTAVMASLDAVVAHAQAFCVRHDLGAHMQRVLILILEELITNTVAHGEATPDSLIEVALDLEGDRSGVSLEYRDRGIPFNPLVDLPATDLTQTMRSRPVGGVGWPLIFNYCASVDYQRAEECNLLRLLIPVLHGAARDERPA